MYIYVFMYINVYKEREREKRVFLCFLFCLLSLLSSSLLSSTKGANLVPLTLLTRERKKKREEERERERENRVSWRHFCWGEIGQCSRLLITVFFSFLCCCWLLLLVVVVGCCCWLLLHYPLNHFSKEIKKLSTQAQKNFKRNIHCVTIKGEDCRSALFLSLLSLSLLST